MINEKLENLIKQALKELSIDAKQVIMEHPDEISHGDYSTNVALVYSKELKIKPKEFAEQVVRYIVQNKPEFVEKIEIAGPGFINFYLSRDFFTKSVAEILEAGQNFGRNSELKGKKVIVEYTDPNAFKPFHIGHLMANAIGESISRLVEFSEAKTIRICYPSDIGLHIAKAIWAIMKNEKDFPKESDSITVKTNFLGKSYVEGTSAYEQGGEVKIEIENINQKIFDKSDKKINEIYDKGRAWSLEHFEQLYKKVDTKFDAYIFESEVTVSGTKIVKEFLEKGVFEKSEGAIIFKGENFGLHTRVFINSKGLPTYETKELGLNFKKFELFPDTAESIIITANEQNDYFKVLKKALELINPKIGEKTKHIGHGMLRFAEGKMSSRKGNVITGESLIEAVEAMVHKKLEERELETFEKNKIAGIVAIGAIKYSILRQSTGSDIIYDFEKSISFEGDSGPYLQYSYVRAKSVLAKAESENIPRLGVRPPSGEGVEISLLERLLCRFPEVVFRSRKEFAPHLVATYLTELAGAFNNYYANNQIVNKDDPNSSYKTALTFAFATVMKNGLWILGIKTPEKM